MYLKLSNFFSFVFHPLWMPIISFFILTSLDSSLVYSGLAKKTIYILLLINTLLPALSIYYLIKKGSLSGVELRNRKERLTPYTLVIFYYAILYYILDKMSPMVSDIIYAMILGIIVSLCIAFFINSYWKISVHMMGIGGLVGSLAGLGYVHPEVNYLYPLLLAIIVAGFVGFSRVFIKAHTPNQVYAGFLLGGIVQFVFVHLGWAFHF